MALEQQVVSVSFGSGVDTKTDSKQVLPGKFISLENAVMVSAKQARKRNGYTQLPTTIMGGGNLSAPKMVRGFKDEIICQDGGFIYGYSPSVQAWVKKGPHESVKLMESFIYKEFSVSGHIDNAVLGNYAIFAWSTSASASSAISTMIAVVDLSSGSIIQQPTAIATFNNTGLSLVSTAPRCVLISNTLAVSYLSGTSIVFRTISISTGGVTYSSEFPIVANAFTGAGQTNVVYDIGSYTFGGVITCIQPGTNNLQTVMFGAGGSIIQTMNQAGVNTISAVALAWNSAASTAWVYWLEHAGGAGSGALYYQIYSTFGSTVLSKTTIASSLANGISYLSAVAGTSTTQTLYYSDIITDSNGSTYDSSYVASVNSSGTASTAAFMMGVNPYSKAFTYSGSKYMVFGYRGGYNSGLPAQIQQTFFVLRLSDGAVVARFAAGVALSAAFNAGFYNPSVSSISSSKFLFSCGINYQYLDLNAGFANTSTGLIGAASVTFDFASNEAYQSQAAGGVLALNGALVSMYDGTRAVELGFHLKPEFTWVSSSTTGGSITAGAYSYIAVWQWTDAQGNLHQSQTSLARAVTIGAGTATNSVTFQITNPYLSQKSNVIVALYRTLGSGTVYYLTSDPVLVKTGNPQTNFTTIIDTTSDTALASRPQLYINGGVASNYPLPPAMAMLPHNNRLFLVDSENPNTAWYSKSFNPGVGLSFSQLLLLQIDPKYGAIAGMAEMDNNIVFLKEQGLCVVAGDGLNDTATGSTFTLPQFVPAECGCVSSKSVFTITQGVVFNTAKGLYLLDRSMTLSYFGAEVEAYNGQNFSQIIRAGNGTRLILLSDTGTTLVYDSFFSQWSVFTNHQGYGGDSISNLLVYAKTDGKIYQENTTTFLDGSTAYAVKAKLAWLKLAGVQGFQRIRRIALLGDYANGTSGSHGVQISAAYDFSTSFSTPIPYVFGASGSSSSFQYRERLPLQKCDAISLYIEEVTTGASGEYIDLTDLSLEVGIKRGINKLSAAKTVG